MTKYDLVKDKIYQKIDYYIEKARECKDLIEFFTLLGWFIAESSELISKSDLEYSDKKELLLWVREEMNVCGDIYNKSYSNIPLLACIIVHLAQSQPYEITLKSLCKSTS